MSLINQMLRDLRQRQGGQPEPPPARRPRRPRRRMSLARLFGSVPPLLWVSAGGLVGLALVWAGAGWLSTVLGPAAPTPVPQLPSELVAVAEAPRTPPDVSPPSRRAPPVPLDVPPPPPPVAYGAAAPAEVAPVELVWAPPPIVAAPPLLPTVTSVTTVATVTAGPNLPRPAVPPVVGGQSEPFRPPATEIPGYAVVGAGRVHPDLLPGAVNVTNLALQRAVVEAAAAPPVITPYGQAEAAYLEGRQFYAQNRSEESLEALRRSLRHYPGHLAARELLVDQLELAGRIEEAYDLLRQGVAIAPDYTAFRKRAARMLDDRGNLSGAVAALVGGGLPRVEDDPELHRMLAQTYLRLGENFLAAQTYRNLLVYAPEDGGLWLGLGDALVADGQPGEARRAYRRALTAGGLPREEVARLQTILAPPMP